MSGATGPPPVGRRGPSGGAGGDGPGPTAGPQVVVVLGTGTEVGKTWVAARLIAALARDGEVVAARKPAQSFDPADAATDAAVLAAASGEAPEAVCPPHRWYPVPLAPPMAAELLGRPAFTIGELVAELGRSLVAASGGWAVIETAGGLRSPLADDGDNLRFAAAVGRSLATAARPARLVLVADAGLGTIHAVRACVEAVAAAGLAAPVVHLNRYDDAAPHGLHRRNRQWLVGRDGLSVTVSIEELRRGLTGPAG